MAETQSSWRFTSLRDWVSLRQSLLVGQIAALHLADPDPKSGKLLTNGHKANGHDHYVSKLELVKPEKVEKEVILTRREDPTVTYFEITKFVVWSIILVLTQMWRDWREGRPFRPTLATESWTHYYASDQSLDGPSLNTD